MHEYLPTFGPTFMNENTGEIDRCEFNLLLITALLNFYQETETKNSYIAIYQNLKTTKIKAKEGQ